MSPEPSRGSLSPEADHVIVSVNPVAGAASSGLRAERLRELASGCGLSVEIVSDLEHLTARTNELHASGRLRALVGVGGDGTAAELVNRTRPGVPLTMLPGGTENLLARHLQIGRTPEEVCETIRSGRLVRMDAGRAGDRIFLVMLSCGFDADVVHRLHRRRGGHIRHLSYAWPIWESLRGYPFPELHVHCESVDGEHEDMEISLSAGWVFAFNLPCYGGGFRIAPQADGSDGRLDLCAFRLRSFWHSLRFVAAVSCGWHHRMRNCVMLQARRLRITSTMPVPYQLDGDPGGTLPVEVEVIPGRLTLLVPQES